MSLNPIEQQGCVDRGLLALRSLGFQFATNRDRGGVVVAVTGFRAHRGVIDIVQLYGEHDADAIRVPGDEPDVLFPRTTIWRTTGAANDVIDNLLGLADPVLEERTTSSSRLRAGFRTVSAVVKRIRRQSPDRGPASNAVTAVSTSAPQTSARVGSAFPAFDIRKGPEVHP